MAKICKPIIEYREIIVSKGITVDDYSPPKKTMKRFIRIFKEIEDTRIKEMTDYPLYEILVIAFLAILGNAAGWNEIERFGKAKEKWFKKFMKLKNGIPSHDTFRRVFSLINPEQLEKSTVMFLIDNMDAIKKSLKIETTVKHLCLDGKEQCATGRYYGTDEEIRNMQTLHVYDATYGICVFSKAIDKKTNEIPVGQEALKMMQLKNSIITFDALHTQKKTIEIIILGGGNYVGALKKNQLNLEFDASTCFTPESMKKIRASGKNYYETKEKSHSQVETRRFYLANARGKFEGVKEWSGLNSFICFEKTIYSTITKKEKTEIRYYITSLKDIELCADAIRGHWSVENQLHWHLDYNFQEDDNTTTDKQAFSNLSLLNKMALSICKLAQPLMNNRSIRMIRKEFSWSFEENLAMILNAFDEDVLKNALENAEKPKKQEKTLKTDF